MALLFASLVFVLLCAATFLAPVRSFYARNPGFMGMVFTLCSCFLGVYGALEFSRSEERQDRMARAATLMEMTRESLTSLSRSRPEAPDTGGDSAREAGPGGIKPVSASPRQLEELLNNGAVLERISPVSLKALLSCQADMQRELQGLAASKGRERRHHLNAYWRELAFAQGVLAAEAEFQRGNIGRGDLEDILREWSLKKAGPAI